MENELPHILPERVLRNSCAERLKDMVSEINADAERMGVVMTFEEEIRHRDRRWQNKLDEKDALLEQSVISLGKKDEQISEQAKIIEDLQRQIEALKANAST